MVHDPANAAAHLSPSNTRLRRLLGGMSIFTMVMTVPQVIAIWVGHQGRRIYFVVECVSSLCRSLVLVWDAATRQEHLLAMCRLDCTGRCRDCGSHRLRISPGTRGGAGPITLTAPCFPIAHKGQGRADGFPGCLSKPGSRPEASAQRPQAGPKMRADVLVKRSSFPCRFFTHDFP
jgi:hypothetical protein